MVCAVINGEDLPHKNELIEKLTEIPSVKSIVLNINRDRTNVILGKECVTVWGNDCIYDVLCGVKVRLSPLSFYQVNHDMAQQLYEKAAEYACLSGKETVLDMYCGTGTIGLSMAKKAKRIIGAEIVPEAVLDAKRNALENGIENAEFICADAGEAAQELLSRGIKPMWCCLTRRAKLLRNAFGGNSKNVARTHSLCVVRPVYSRKGLL